MPVPVRFNHLAAVALMVLGVLFARSAAAGEPVAAVHEESLLDNVFRWSWLDRVEGAVDERLTFEPVTRRVSSVWDALEHNYEVRSGAAPMVASGQLNPLPEPVFEKALEALAVNEQQFFPDYPNLATQRLPFAIFEIEPARPQSLLRVRYDLGFGVDRPDRAEYFWAAIGKDGPPNQVTNVDYQEFTVFHEVQFGKSSGTIEIPLRSVDSGDRFGPIGNGRTTGVGSLKIGAKRILFEGEDFFGIPTSKPGDQFVVSTVFRSQTVFSPHQAKQGATAGTHALEPGLLFGYRRSPYTMFHGQVKYLIPLSGVSGFQGNVLKYGVGVSHVLYSSTLTDPDDDSYGIIPTFEINRLEYGFGKQTVPGGNPHRVNGLGVVNLQPGIRVVLGHRFEAGFSAAFAVSNERFFQQLYRFEFGWFW